MAGEELEKEKKTLEKIRKWLKSKGCKRSHLLFLMEVYPTREVEATFKTFLRKRKHPKVKNRVEAWLETFYVNYFEKNGKLPSKKEVRETIVRYFEKLRIKDEKLHPFKYEFLLNRVYYRVYMRFKRQEAKKKKQEVKKKKEEEKERRKEVAKKEFIEYLMDPWSKFKQEKL